MNQPRALVVSYGLPQEDRDSGGRRLHDLIRFLQELGWSVDFVGMHGSVGKTDYEKTLQRQGVAVHGDRGLRQDDLSWTEGDRFAECVERGNFDLALLCFWPVAEYCLPVLRRLSPRTRVVVDSVDIHFLRESRQITGEKCGDPSERLLDGYFASRLIAELNVYAAADATLTVSDTERELLDRFLGERVMARVVGDCEDPLPSAVPMKDRSGLLFLGSFEHLPNVKAIEFFLGEVLPRIDARLLEKHPVYVAGNGLDEKIAGLAAGHPHVRMVGWVPSVVPYFHRARATVVPLLFGAGTKRKVVQALMYGTPLVSTDIGIEGLDIVPEEHALVANDAASLAASIERLLTDEKLCCSLAESGLAHIVRARGRETARAALAETIDDVMKRAVKPAMLADGSLKNYLGRLSTRPARPQGEHAGGSGATGAETVRLIAFYLPQFHPIPENDAWWGRGFTEWHNVGKAKPLFHRHHQPHLPTDLGFYDLRLPETRKAQADLARQNGIHGFCYYHYWFQGKRLLERPFAEVLASGQPDFPFCLCWANEPWSRRWDGCDAEVLQPQTYSPEDDLAHIRWLLGPLSDPRAIRIDGRPVFIVYRADQLPDPDRTIACWRQEAERAGLPGLYLMAVETGWDSGWDATQVGFDAKILFQPQFSLLDTVGRQDVWDAKAKVFNYDSAWPVLANPPPVSYPRFDTVFPGWDNTARRGEHAWVVHDNTPASYENWLRVAVERTMTRPQDERVVFINAWNEWAEGAYLEPDSRHGHGFLEATRRVVSRPHRAQPSQGR